MDNPEVFPKEALQRRKIWPVKLSPARADRHMNINHYVTLTCIRVSGAIKRHMGMASKRPSRLHYVRETLMISVTSLRLTTGFILFREEMIEGFAPNSLWVLIIIARL